MSNRAWIGFAACTVVLALSLFSLWRGMQAGTSETPPVNVTVSRIVRLPVQYLTSDSEPNAMQPDRLTLDAGAEDEAEEGPGGFDVLADGGFVVSDPLRRRLVFYDAQARYIRQLNTSVPVDEVVAQADGALLARKSGDGEWLSFTTGGTANASSPAELPGARLTGPGRGFVAGAKGEVSGIPISWSEPALTLAAIQNLGSDARENVYVALEGVAAQTSDWDVRRVVRKYRRNGSTAAEVRDLVAERFVSPVQELRARNGKLYQLVPLSNEVRIYMWDLSTIP